jgi:thioredoxin 1
MTVLLTVAAILAFVAGYVYISYKKMKNAPEVEKSLRIKDLTDKNFNHQIKENISLVDFWAPWCMPCKIMAPILNEIADQSMPGVQVCKLNVDEFQSVAAKYGIRGIPTTVLFRNGKEVERFVGVKSRDFLINQIKNIK